MKTIHILTLSLFISLSWISCKNAPAVQGETTEQTGMDSVFIAKQADAIHNIDAYTRMMSNKVQELETALSAAADDSKESIQAELSKCKEIQNEVETVRNKVNKATPDIWEEVMDEFQTMHINVRMAVAKEKVSIERAGEVAN